MSRITLIIILFFVILVNFPVYAQGELSYGLENTIYTQTALEAAMAAKNELDGVAYSWYGIELAHCSGFGSRYLERLGYPVELVNESPYRYVPENQSPIPASSTHMQVMRFELLNAQLEDDYTFYISVEELLAADFDWQTRIQPGSLIYWSKAEAQISYNGWAHVTILLGYQANSGEPIFAEFAGGMNNGPMLGRSLKEVADGLYYSDALQRLDLTPYGEPSQPLQAYVVNVIGMYNVAENAGIFREEGND